MSYSYQCPKGHTDTRDNNRHVFCDTCNVSYPKQSLNDPQELAKLKTSSTYVSPKRWSASHDVIHYLMPYSHFNVDPWDQLKQFKDHLVSIPDSKATFKWRDLDFVNYGGDCSERLKIFSDLLGSYVFRRKSSRPSVWVNPYYMHFDELDWTPDEDKIVHWLRLGLYGRFTSRDLCSRFGNSPGTFSNIMSARAIPYGELRDYGKKRLANTVLAARDWEGYSVRECAKRLDMPRRTLTTWVNTHGDFDANPPSSKPFSNDWG